jgi:hypothetical protein
MKNKVAYLERDIQVARDDIEGHRMDIEGLEESIYGIQGQIEHLKYEIGIESFAEPLWPV